MNKCPLRKARGVFEMRCGCVIHSLFKDKIDILSELLRIHILYLVNKEATKVTIVDDEIIYHLRCSPEENFTSCTRIKVYAWDPHGEDFESFGEKIHWEKEINIKFHNKYLQGIKDLIKKSPKIQTNKSKDDEYKNLDGRRDVIPVTENDKIRRRK